MKEKDLFFLYIYISAGDRGGGGGGGKGGRGNGPHESSKRGKDTSKKVFTVK